MGATATDFRLVCHNRHREAFFLVFLALIAAASPAGLAPITMMSKCSPCYVQVMAITKCLLFVQVWFESRTDLFSESIALSGNQKHGDIPLLCMREGKLFSHYHVRGGQCISQGN